MNWAKKREDFTDSKFFNTLQELNLELSWLQSGSFKILGFDSIKTKLLFEFITRT